MQMIQPYLDDMLDFHVQFEQIHPFQDGNGRVGRLLMSWQCLQAGIVPFIITEDFRLFYYRGLQSFGAYQWLLVRYVSYRQRQLHRPAGLFQNSILNQYRCVLQDRLFEPDFDRVIKQPSAEVGME